MQRSVLCRRYQSQSRHVIVMIRGLIKQTAILRDLITTEKMIKCLRHCDNAGIHQQDSASEQTHYDQRDDEDQTSLKCESQSVCSLDHINNTAVRGVGQRAWETKRYILTLSANVITHVAPLSPTDQTDCINASKGGIISGNVSA